MSVRAQDHGAGRKYYTEVPNLVFALGLTPFELALYVHLKRTAGEQGRCWKSTLTLASETGMSAGMVSKAKEGLEKKRPELGDKPLILVTQEANPNGGKPRHVVTLTDIWPENVSRFQASSSPPELANSPDELDVHHMNFTSSPHELKKNPSEEEPMRKERQPKKQVVGATAQKPVLRNDPLLVSPAVIIYRDFCRLTPPVAVRPKIAAVENLVLWAEVCEAFMLEGRPPQRVDWLLERYEARAREPARETPEQKQVRLQQQWKKSA